MTCALVVYLACAIGATLGFAVCSAIVAGKNADRDIDRWRP